jgi:hypothetical protein
LAAVGCGSSGGSNKNSPAQPKTANGQSATVGVAGDTNGQGVNAFGGVWYVVSSSGDEVTTPTGSGGGFGY